MKVFIYFFFLAFMARIAWALLSRLEPLPIIDLGYALDQATVNVCLQYHPLQVMDNN